MRAATRHRRKVWNENMLARTGHWAVVAFFSSAIVAGVVALLMR
ncbi:MAG TPA: hypothetical protein VKR31_11255 [Rhizomicrobium sp.]|nr:hypothetical protein [Rhizomicrobium sp.]